MASTVEDTPPPAAPFHDHFQRYRTLIEGHDTFGNVKDSFVKTGKGRRKKLEFDFITNRFLLQLNVLREQSGKSWEDTESFLAKYTEISTPYRLRTLIESATKTFRRISLPEEAAVFLDQATDMDGLGPFCMKAGITRQALLRDQVALSTFPPTNGLMIELNKFRTSQGLPLISLHKWLYQMSGVRMDERQIHKLVKKVQEDYRKLCTGKKEARVLDVFKETTFRFETVSLPSHAVTTTCLPESQLFAPKGRELAAARRQIDDQSKELQEMKSQVSVLIEEGKDKTSTISFQEERIKALDLSLAKQIEYTAALEEVNVQLRAEIHRLQNEQQQLESDRACLVKEVQSGKQQSAQNVTRRLKRLQKAQASEKEEICLLRKREEALKASNRSQSRKLLRITRENRMKREELADLNKELESLRRRCTAAEKRADARPQIRLKDPETGYFLPEAKLCIIELMGQHEIASERCGAVIETICRHILHADIPKDDLPSARSVGRFVDVGHLLGKYQVADTLLSAEHFDLHADGTTKNGKKILGHQVTTDSGDSLSLGFTTVGTENTQTLANVALGILEELCLVYGEDDQRKHEVFMEMLQNLSGLMSDRAAVMKSYSVQLNQQRKELLQTEDDLAFLNCNAHFLLGLVHAVEKTLKYLAANNAGKMGREKDQKFSASTSGEHPVIRCIREACACLGPRGDERFGCRQNWLAFCEMVSRKSEITSFKANRFNNLFEASAVLHYHQQDITEFLRHYMGSLNWKQEGVLGDLDCTSLDNYLVALGLLFFRLTGPYWRLLGMTVKYLDFYAYVVLMKQFLERWATDPADAFATQFEPLFGIDMGCTTNNIFLSLVSITEDRQQCVCIILKTLSAAFLQVVEKQLKDFLPGPPAGRYYAVTDGELRQRLRHSQLTNIVGEQCFGDFDFSMFKRRNASAHYHSSLSILKRNNTISHWFNSLPNEQQEETFAKASSSKAALLRKKHKSEEKKATEVRQRVLQENRLRKEEMARRQREKKADIVRRIRHHGGPCSTAEDVDKILKKYQTKGQKVAALKAETSYHKLVLGIRSPLLKISAKFPELLHNLKAFLGRDKEN